MSAPSYAQAYHYPPPPSDPYATPWVGSNTPWVYYNGDWFLNGILYYFFGPQIRLGPVLLLCSHLYRETQHLVCSEVADVVQGHPDYCQHFQQAYPYWREHRQGRRYDEKFFEQHQHGQVGEWQKGFRGHPEVQGTGVRVE